MSERLVPGIVWSVGAALVVVAGAAGIVWGLVPWRQQQRALEDAIRLVGEGAYSAAVPALVAATAAVPGDPRAHYYLARAYFCLGAHAGALGQLRAVVPGPPRATDDAVARAAARLDRGDRDAALAMLRDEVTRHPDALDARLLLAATLDTAGDRAGEREQYQQVAQRVRGSALAPVLAPPIQSVPQQCPMRRSSR